MKILLASNNLHKIAEIRAILRRDVGEEIDLLSLAGVGFDREIVEDGSTFEENALIKARAGASTGYICMADDSGLCVDALGGAPGVHSARYAGTQANDAANNEKLLFALSGLPDAERKAKFVSVVALVFPKENAFFTVRGECPGRILKEKKGTSGFGYDPLFYLEDRQKTFAELTSEEKNLVSHRARSMERFTKLLKIKLKEYGYLC